MSDVSPKSFLSLLQKSGLCEPDELKATINQLFEKAGSRKVKLNQLTEHLLEAGLVSDWHVKKLSSGRYKGFFLGKYKLLRHLGTGGMSTVYLAQHTIFNQQRAIKVLPRDRVADRTYLQRFYREGRAAAALNHRNIVRVYDIGNEGDTHYLVMEYVKGKDISDMVRDNGPLPYDKAIDYTIQALTGLQHAHENDLVHRDIKPANLLVTPDGVVKILDLGLALFQEEDTSLTVMHNERVLGTADYLSPEQAIDSHNVDLRSDIYSTGCTIYFMLTGQPPFPEGTIAQRIAKHQAVEPQDIKEFRNDCPADLLAVVHKMMRKKPDDRYQNCEPLIAELRQLADGLMVSAPKIKTEKKPVAKREAATKKPSPKATPKPAKPVSKGRGADKKVTSESTRQKEKVSANATSKPAEKKAAAKQDAARGPKHPAKKPAASPQPKSPPKQERSARKPAAQQAASEKTIITAAVKPPKQSKASPSQPAAKKRDAAKPVADKTTSAKESSLQQPARRPTSKSAVAQVGRKPHVDASEVSVIVPEEHERASDVGLNELRSFVAQNRSTVRQSAKPKRDTVKDQVLMAGLVIGMLLLLGLVLILAVNFAT